ncbi:hypothetical protein CK203_088666 [Vitis vinifera]|uniref:BAH domain-containing protein n=1 Tax=Vitis vinifera TaxID=29760 RepID=A0A438D4B3_VITVI|nr:hypothetical protein CK203_088666 [Vitis vinifera]|eukprot:XP_019073628.1 PREDICTED: uncharacterized protein LOC104878146 [Vitis vinifera]
MSMRSAARSRAAALRSSARSSCAPGVTRSAARSFHAPILTRSAARSSRAPILTRSAARSSHAPILTRSAARSLCALDPSSISKSIPSRSSYAQDETLDRLDSETNNSKQAFGSLEFSVAGSSARQTLLPDQMVHIPRKLKAQNSDIVWSGDAWICTKQLKHYPAFCRDETTISVHSFVFIMAEDESNYLGYLEDLYEDRKGQKKVKVRWFHHKQEVMRVIPGLDPQPREVFITSHVQVISAECIDGPATVLTPKHYEKCLAVVPQTLSSGIHLCCRQFKNNKVKPFTLTKLRGYSDQAILSCLSCSLQPEEKGKSLKLDDEEEEELAHRDPVGRGAKKNRSRRGQQRLETGFTVKDSTPGNESTKCKPAHSKLKLKLPRNSTGIKFGEPQTQYPVSFKLHEKIELLCQDSGVRGCWFRCKILQASQKRLKVQYADVEDVEGPGNLEEWVPAFRVAAPDKLGIRCAGRLTIRPFPPEDCTEYTFEVGAAVDAWWGDGWWEGVVTRVGISGNDSLQVYLPGEGKLLTFEKKNLRTSRDWVGNKWVELKSKPDILHCVPVTASTMAEAFDSGASALLDLNILTTHKVEAVGECKKVLPGSGPHSGILENVQGLNLRKRLCHNNEEKAKKGVSDSLVEDFESADQKYVASEDMEVVL